MSLKTLFSRRWASSATLTVRQTEASSLARYRAAHLRRYATDSGASSSSKGSSALLWGAVAAAVGGGAYYYLSTGKEHPGAVKNPASPQKLDYQEVYNEVAKLLEAEDYDDGSFGPVLVRLAWHASGTYDKKTGNGGSNGATMRFHPEANHGANAGLIVARDLLEPVKRKFGDDLTYSDLWTLAGVAAIQEMGGPLIPWRPGRQDGLAEHCTPDGRLPDGDKGSDHLRDIFWRQGFNDQEIVALSGAHVLGRCHKDRSGFDGPWSFSPTMFTNDYYKLLLDEKWNLRKWQGPPQYQDTKSKSLMMLLTDMALVQDKAFKPWVDKYAANEEAFFKDFSAVFSKLLENGVPHFKAAPLHFTKTEDQ